MSILTEIKNELKELGIKPSKGLGQNFLVNEGIYKKIVASLELEGDDILLEVGPGLGTLTAYLAESGAIVNAVEKDRKLIGYLTNKFRDAKNVKITEGDILKFRPENLGLKDGRYKVVGNIPYYITSHLLKMISEEWPQPKLVVLMVQKEVAQRIKAKSPEMSLLAVSVQYYAKPEIISYVSKGSFYPSPDINSAIIRLTPHALTDSASFQKKLFQTVKTGFAGKRKQLLNNLSRGMKAGKDQIQKKLNAIGVDPQRRAETLTIEEWRKITNIFYSPR